MSPVFILLQIVSEIMPKDIFSKNSLKILYLICMDNPQEKFKFMISGQLYFQMQPIIFPNATPWQIVSFQNNFSVYLISLTVTNRNSD